MSAMCQVRHRMKAVPVTVKHRSGTRYVMLVYIAVPWNSLLIILVSISTSDLVIEFQGKPEIGISPGQVVGLWCADGDWCLGSGLIAATTCMM